MKPLLGLTRAVIEWCPSLTVPKSAVTAVGIDREQIEELRKAKGIKVQEFELLLNLSRSRYYRWLQYATDLPLEFIMGIKKILGLTNNELFGLMIPETEEFLAALLVAAYPLTNPEVQPQGRNMALEADLLKYGQAVKRNNLHRLILAFYTLSQKTRTDNRLESQCLEDYFAKLTDFSLFDTLLYLAYADLTLADVQGFAYHAKYGGILRYVKRQLPQVLTTERRLLYGVWLDVALMQFFVGNISDAKITLADLKAALIADGSTQFEVLLVSNLHQVMHNFSQPSIQKELIASSQTILAKQKLVLSAFEYDYWQQILLLVAKQVI